MLYLNSSISFRNVLHNILYLIHLKIYLFTKGMDQNFMTWIFDLKKNRNFNYLNTEILNDLCYLKAKFKLIGVICQLRFDCYKSNGFDLRWGIENIIISFLAKRYGDCAKTITPLRRFRMKEYLNSLINRFFINLYNHYFFIFNSYCNLTFLITFLLYISYNLKYFK